MSFTQEEDSGGASLTYVRCGIVWHSLWHSVGYKWHSSHFWCCNNLVVQAAQDWAVSQGIVVGFFKKAIQRDQMSPSSVEALVNSCSLQ